MDWIDDLKNWRSSKKWSQTTAAKEFGVPAQTYRNWEYGLVKDMPGSARKLFEIFKGIGK